MEEASWALQYCITSKNTKNHKGEGSFVNEGVGNVGPVYASSPNESQWALLSFGTDKMYKM